MTHNHDALPPDHNIDDSSPSALFLEMMRQAARQESDESLPEHSATVLPSIAPDQPAPVADDDVAPPISAQPDTAYQEAIPALSPAEPIPSVFSEEAEATATAATHEDVVQPVMAASARVPVYDVPTLDEPQDDTVRQQQLEAQRVRRIRRRQQRRQQRRGGILGGFFRTAIITLIAALLASTIFTWFTDPEFFKQKVVTHIQVADSTSIAALVPLTPTVIAVTPNWARRIGIVSGHRGPENDPGAVCPDGLTEREINFGVAQLVVRGLRDRGYSVDLLDEFDPRLVGYQASALVSIHANDCSDYGEYVSGYLVARASARPSGGLDDTLAECVAREYEPTADIPRLYSLTIDMTDYHTFREIHALTPAAILELGFMKDDRELLTTQQPRLAEGIVAGILCFLNGESPSQPMTETPAPSPSPQLIPTLGGS